MYVELELRRRFLACRLRGCILRVRSRRLRKLFVLASTLLLIFCLAAGAQVSPSEILNPQLKAAEETYLPQLKALNRAIGSVKFPFTFYLSRYVGLDPKQQVETDTRGIEFVKFHDRVVLKITGNYDAAYNADSLTDNERASRTFQGVIAPVLHLVINTIPSSITCDAIGFEVSYHVRTRSKSYDYEGKEIVVVVLDKPDAFGFFDSPRDSERQEMLNRSEIYLDGRDFGLQLGERNAVDVEALGRPTSHSPAPSVSSAPAAASDSGVGVRLPALYQNVPSGFHPAEAAATPAATMLTAQPDSGNGRRETAPSPAPAATEADAERLQAKYQSQLDALAKAGAAQLHLVGYAPPSFAIFRNQIVLQMTLRNTLHFEKDTSSIYKRAAQTFDLFLAPQLKDFLDKLPASAGFDGLDVSVVNQLAPKPTPASEVIEFICPLRSLQQFVDADITNQELINQSVVLVNGFRIALSLQQVE